MEAQTPYLVASPNFEDERGFFNKPFSYLYPEVEEFNVREVFWSQSNRGVIRGLHFQTAPFSQNKIIWVTSGSILDVLVDIRDGRTFGTVHTFEIDIRSGALFVPKGFAHGFLSLEDGTIVNYALDAVYSPEHDKGILWKSIDFDWGIVEPIVSQRDRKFLTLDDLSRLKDSRF